MRLRPRNSATTCPSASRVTVTSVMPLRPYAVRTRPSATSTSPRRLGAVKRDVGTRGHRETPLRVAGQREARVGEGEDVAAVADGVPVDHVVTDRHAHDGVVGLDDDGLHAEGPRGLVVGPHLPGEVHPGRHVGDRIQPSPG